MLFGCFFNSHFVFVSGKHISFLNACAFGFAVIISLVLLEAMEHGLPCISTTEGEYQELFDDGKTGFLVPKHDVAVLAI